MNNATLTATRPGEEPELESSWDTRLFVLRGEDRPHLRARALSLANSIARIPEFEPARLAATLASDLLPRGETLAIVASSLTDLETKLRRGSERLGQSNCQFIRDASGIYFASQPLFRSGSLGLLFPGEGAQYSGMLADLCRALPEVEETFAWCDQLAVESGRADESLRQLFHPPPTASEEDRAAAEVKIRRLGPSIFGVLVADLALYRVIQSLELPISAMAGHSAGELAALAASGAIRDDAMFGPKLVDIMDLMQRQEDAKSGVEVALLAVGAARSAVVEIADSAVGGSVIIAMDNCPHQCIAVGESRAISRVEAALLERGLVCERLPFRRPYHTALFEPWMQPYRELFADISFEHPHTPVYCCTTAQPFPSDPETIRKLAVNQWVSPVEFSRTIQNMYEDGVRIFVEAGPRGNLSAFTEDILRGRSFAAIPANVLRKSGPTQINHLVAQLLIHEVPVNLQHLFWDIVTEPLDWEKSNPRTFAASDAAGSNGQIREHDAVMHGFLDVMEQFLDVQQSLMNAFLTGDSVCDGDLPIEEFDFADFALQESQANESADSTLPYALINKVVEFEPGHSIIARRALDLKEDLYADHHTLAGRGVSRIDPGQNGLPVLPMTFSVEAMAEAALLLAPGNVVIAIRNLRLYRWVPFDPEPTTLEVRATIKESQENNGFIEVTANVRDLGNSFLKDGATKVAAEATLILAAAYPPSPQPLDFSLTEERPCQSTVEDLRRNMFHGPLFQMLQQLSRLGQEGIEGVVEVQPRTGWFHSNPEPHVVLDPVLLDATMHILGAWHLEQPDWTGRILLPFEISSLEFFSPIPEVGSHLLVRGHNEQESARHFRHAMEIFHPDGSLWYRMTGAGYWRFYLPFGHVNFFGPKDEYFLCRDWSAAVSPRNNATAQCYFLDPPVDLKQPVLRAAGARVTMTPREQEEFRAWNGTDEELNNWFFGRLVAKDAVRAAWVRKRGEAIFPADIETEPVDGRLVCRPRGQPEAEPYPPVSFAIGKGRVAAVSAFASQVGIALLEITKDDAILDISARAACLAAADALRIPADALTATPTAGSGEFAITPLQADSHRFLALTNWPLIVQTARDKNWIVATSIRQDAST